MPKIKKRTARSTLDVNVVVGASSSAVAQAGGKKRKAAGPRKLPVPQTMSTRKNPLLIASLREMGINASSHVEDSHPVNSDAGTGPQMVAGSRSRDPLTFVGQPEHQLSLPRLPETRISDTVPGPQMVAGSLLQDSLTSVGNPAHQPSLIDAPVTALSFILPRDELLPSGRSDASPRDTPIVDTPRPRTLVRTFEIPLSAHVVNAEIVSRTLGSSEAGASLQPPPRHESNTVGGSNLAPVPVVPQPGGPDPIPPVGTGAGFTGQRSAHSESEDDMQSIHSHRSERSRRSTYQSESEHDYSTERIDPVPKPAPQQRRRLRDPELTSLEEVEEERRRRRERELAAARDAEINDLIQRTRCLTAEVGEFVEGMRNTFLYGKTREEGQSLYDESSKCVREILMLRGVNLQPELAPLREARGRLRQLCTNSDKVAAATPVPNPAQPSVTRGAQVENGDGGGSGRRPGPPDEYATIARAQLDYEIARLNNDVLCDVSPDVKVKAEKLQNLAKVTVPDVRKTVD
jgi:hypothetical protein